MLPLRLLPRTAWTVYLHLDRYCNRGHSCDRDHYRDRDQKEEMPQLQNEMRQKRKVLPALWATAEIVCMGQLSAAIFIASKNCSNR